MKASEVLNLLKITRPTLTKYVKEGWLEVETMPNGRYWYKEDSVYAFLNKREKRKNVIYARVSTHKQKPDLKNQIESLRKYAFASGIKVESVYSDVASGISFEKRVEFFRLIDEVLANKIDKVIISYKDRLSRIGFEFFSVLFKKFGTEIEVVSGIGSEKLDSEEIFEEIVHLIHAFSMKLYSSRKGKKIEIAEEVQ